MKKFQKKIIDRFDLGEVSTKGIWFKLEGVDISDVSILNVGKLMSSAPFEWSGFSGWEALFKSGKTIRENSLSKLLNKLI